MSLYLKNDYITKVHWFKKDNKVKVYLPKSIIADTKRQEQVKEYRLDYEKIIVNNDKTYNCPNYAIRTAIAVDLFCCNIVCNLPCSEIYYVDIYTEKASKFTIKQLDIDLTVEDLAKERCLADVFSHKTTNRQTLSEKFEVETGFEFVSNLIANGGL